MGGPGGSVVDVEVVVEAVVADVDDAVDEECTGATDSVEFAVEHPAR
jgi:hypothetical protein